MRTIGAMAALVGFVLIGVGMRLRFLYFGSNKIELPKWMCLHYNKDNFTVDRGYWSWTCMNCGKRKTEKMVR